MLPIVRRQWAFLDVKLLSFESRDLYSATPEGLFRRDFKTNLWETAGAGLPHGQALGIAATT